TTQMKNWRNFYMVQTGVSTDDLDFSKCPQEPHGGKHVNQVLTGKEREEDLKRAENLTTIMVDLEVVITVEMIATGVLSPNDGFMGEEDYNSVLDKGRLATGTVWPIPLSFAPIGNTNEEIISKLSVGDEVVLADEKKQPIAIQKLDDILEYDKDKRDAHLFGRTDRSHPRVDCIYLRMGDTALGGP